MSIPGIGPVFASGILSEIGTISNFDSNDKLAKYAGITWRETQSGSFSSDNTRMTKTGNKYLRYYLFEATSSIIRHIPEYKNFYQKKYDESTIHKHKRALALTTRKFIGLIFSLLSKNQLYSNNYVE
ncbi:transposase [Peptoniphilus sp.]|uniref:transposase n=1 Tax=Peptoniphilus sp. TaxID=1971214 RepID=UPI0039BF687C